MYRIAVIITCYNRKEKTVSCLKSLYSNIPSDVSINVYLVDDKSTDGTVDAVREHFPSVKIIIASGSHFWNGGMHLGFSSAAKFKYDAYLWLNDDVDLDVSALEKLRQYMPISIERSAILIGSCYDKDTLRSTYGGLERVVNWHPSKFSVIQPDASELLLAETMNGNFVFIPHSVVESIGFNDSRFTHSMGDTDFGLRASKAGHLLYILPGYIGCCSRNPISGTYDDNALTLKQRWKLVTGFKGYPVYSWMIYMRRHGGLFWPVFWVWPYVKVILSGLLSRRGL